MTWKESFAIGVEEIDREHKLLCDKIDELYYACFQGKNTDEVLKMLGMLEIYTISHFAEEEKYQKKINYPNYVEHKVLHVGFLKRMEMLKKAAVTGHSTLLIINISSVIAIWLVNHILKDDAEIKNYIN